MKKFFTYILRCSDKTLYVGCTNDLERRLKQHNNSKWGAHYTKIRRPVKLLYSETFLTLKEARRRETEIKGWTREKKLELVEPSSTNCKRRTSATLDTSSLIQKIC